MIFSLDISSTKIGYCLFSLDDCSIIRSGTLIFSNKKTFEEKAYEFEEFIDSIIRELAADLDGIVVEDRLKAFAGGRSSASSLIKVANMNAMGLYFLYKSWQKYKGSKLDNLTKYHPSTLKKLTGLGGYMKTASALMSAEEKKRFRKTAGIEFVAQTFSSWHPERSRTGSYKKGVDDEADAILLCLAKYNQCLVQK